MNILIVKLSSLGDVIHTLPAAQAIRAAFPEAHLAWAVESSHAAIAHAQGWLDEVIEWRRRGPREFAEFVRSLRAKDWDVALDFQGLFRSGLVTRLSGARRRIGFKPARELAHWFYNDPVPRSPADCHAVERSVVLANHLGAQFPALPLRRPYLHGLPPADAVHPFRLFPLRAPQPTVVAVDKWLGERGFDSRQHRLVVLNPHCRREANRWPAGHFTALARRLLALQGVRVALLGGAAARELCDEVAGPLARLLWRADGQFDLLGSADLLSRSSVLVTGDTGPMHLAAAAGTSIVALLGATDANRTGPYTANAVVLQSGLSCSPCLARHCPLGIDPPPCMEQIHVDRVFEVVCRRLSELEAVKPQRKSA